MIYFAYGSNLCIRRFHSRVPSAEFMSVASMADHKLLFKKRSDDGSGKATLAPKSGQVTYGVLYSIHERDLAALRKAEGYPRHYREESVQTKVADGTTAAMTYLAQPDFCDETQVPYDWYLGLIWDGAQHFELPAPYVAALRAMNSKPDPDPVRRARELAFLTSSAM